MWSVNSFFWEHIIRCFLIVHDAPTLPLGCFGVNDEEEIPDIKRGLSQCGYLNPDVFLSGLMSISVNLQRKALIL
jgi:hypothetical protein